MSFFRSVLAHICAIEVGALVVCCGLMVIDAGPLAIVEGIAMWIVGQAIILAVALAFLPIGLLLRFAAGSFFTQPKPTALVAGASAGTLATLLFADNADASLRTLLLVGPLGFLSGLAGGWTWVRVEFGRSAKLLSDGKT